jgi:hypothetical protein
MGNSIKTVLLSTMLVLFVVWSCSKEEDSLVKKGPFNISELAGNWEATSAGFTGSDMAVELIAEGGTVTMSVQSSGKFTMSIDPVDRTAYTVSGEMFWEEWEGNSYFAIEWDDYPGDWDTYGATLTTSTLSISGGFDTGEYDFDNDGTFESVRVNFEFIRV